MYDYINTMVGTQKERGGEMEVEIIKAKGAGEDTSTGSLTWIPLVWN